MTVLQSYLAGQWFGSQAAKPLASAINGEIVAHTHDDAPDFAAAVDYARTTGTRELLKLDFQERAARLKAMALYLQEHKKELYTLSRHTGATKGDNAFDIDGGFGTLFAYASMGRKELPSGNVLHEGPVVPSARKTTSPPPTSWCRAGASRCTSTPSTSRSGACWKNSPATSSPACRVW
ncbi:Bifunctional protein PaaZ [Alcanivorax sp. ALC70]|nr:Bifunctional protein PaaZ [Alcanivorax sp. ALC70]